MGAPAQALVAPSLPRKAVSCKESTGAWPGPAEPGLGRKLRLDEAEETV